MRRGPQLRAGPGPRTSALLRDVDDLVHRNRVQVTEELVASGRGEPGGLPTAFGERRAADQPRAAREGHVVRDAVVVAPGQAVARLDLDVLRREREVLQVHDRA